MSKERAERWILAMLVVLLIMILAACAPQTAQIGDAVKDAGADIGSIVSDAAGDAGRSVIETTAPIAIAIADAVQPTIASEPLPPLPIDPAIELITRWEVVSHPYYIKRLQRPICPPPPSGPTGGIGYDFGHQTKTEIRRVWGWHPDADALVQASGQIGVSACNAWRNANPTVRITLADAKRVFASDSLPKYRLMAEKALPGLVHQSPGHNSGLTSYGYRRGWSMEGERMREKRVIRADCVPASNSECSAGQVIASCRIWVNRSDYKGQCNRSHDEARVIRQ